MIKELNDKFINNYKARPLHRFRELLGASIILCK